MGRCSRDPHRLGGRGDRPAFLEHTRDEQESAEGGETSPTMGHESLLPVRSFGQPQTVQGGSRLSTTLMGTTTRPPARRAARAPRCGGGMDCSGSGSRRVGASGQFVYTDTSSV